MGSLIGCYQFLTTSPRLKAWLKEQRAHLQLYETRVRELQGVVGKLKKVRDAIRHKVDEEQHRHGRGILDEVEEWLERVDELIFQYEDFNEDKCHELAVFDLFRTGYLPKPGIRYDLSRQAYDITKTANGLLQTAKFNTFSYWLGPPSMAAFFSNIGYESFPSREVTMKKIIAELEDPSVKMIGLHGLSGVGKTTLVKEVVKEALEAKIFDVVTMASVTRDPDIRKIQGQIVDMLGVTLDEESDIARAARIQNILKNEKKSTLIILDHLWKKLDFNMLGIPCEIDNEIDGPKNVKKEKSLGVDGSRKVREEKSAGAPNMRKSKKLLGASNMMKTEETLSQYKGCKILMISESKQILLSQIEGKRSSILSVEVLEETEAETLFRKMAGIVDKNSEFEKLAAQIATKCKGLPMSIVTTARALKNQSRSAWEDVHRKLEWQKLTGAPEFSTKLSYNLLENEELKFTFLLCARMGQDALIMDLVKYCIGIGFLEGIHTVRETRDRVFALVAQLKESGLLSDSYSGDRFTMQDIVRSAALSIAREEKKLFVMTKGAIDEWPDKLERYTAISLHHCEFTEGFPRRINYSRLRVFHVNNNDPHLEIPKNFFKGMKELKVLILTGIHFSPLDSSVSALVELRMLSLEQCMLDKELSCIGELKRLRILSFSGSDIRRLPVELKQLKKLQIFDISNCSKLHEIPSGVISSLISLEELYMGNTLIQWEVEEHTYKSKNASLSELKLLNRLATLDLQITNVSYLPMKLFFDKLRSYKIVIGDLNAYLDIDFKMPEKYETLRCLVIQLKDEFDVHSQDGIKMLFERVESLFLEELSTVQDIFYELNLNGFPYLKHLLIVNNSTMQSLIYPKDRLHLEIAFPRLESLCLYNLKIMDKLCYCELLEPSFGNLKVIKIILCDQLKSVFLFSLVRLLTVLETIEVSECNSLKEIVPMERQGNTNEIKLLKFSQLRSLKLQSLFEFIGFYPISSTEGAKELFHTKVEVSKLERMELSSIQIDIIWSDQISIRSCYQNLTHLDVNDCWNLEYLSSFSMAKSLVSLQSLFVSKCEKMRSIFPREQDSLQKMKGSIFPKLKNIQLSSMKSLDEIWNSELPSDSFSKLDTLIIDKCEKLSKVFPCYMEGIFRSLCNLRVTNCRSMQVMFDLTDIKRGTRNVTNLMNVHLETLPKLEHVWKLNIRGGILNLNHLKKVWVQDCRNLENIFPFSIAKSLHNLEYLVVCDCHELRVIVAKGEVWNSSTTNSYSSFSFPKLSTIKFSELPNLASFYPGAYKLSCPALNDLSIVLCDKLEPFSKETVDSQRKLVIFSEEVINKLKYMQIEHWHAKSPTSYMGKGNHRRNNLQDLCLSRLMNTEILYSFFRSNPNLKSLSLNSCFFEEMVPFERATKTENMGVVPKLKSLKLMDLPNLKNIGFKPDLVLERIEFMILKNCPSMVTMVPSSASLTYLTHLEVVHCNGLEYLMSPSTAKSLHQLNTMKVMKCESLEEIVKSEENNTDIVDIVFRQLKSLELVSLKSLNSFCSSKCCVFEFPSLEKLVVSGCYKMENFSEEVKSMPILQNIYTTNEKEKKICCWEGDLNATIQKMFREKRFFEGMEEISFSEHDVLKRAWEAEVSLQNSWFHSLKTLKLENCEIQPYAIPSDILPCLKTLKELEVRHCDNIEAIFNMKDTQILGTTYQLHKLSLEGLSKLKHVWEVCENNQGILTFQNLQQVVIKGCQDLQTLFPGTLTKSLKKIEKIEIVYCEGLQEIVGKKRNETANTTEKFVFPSLTLLNLFLLPNLTYFYPESFTLECPELNELLVLDCPKFKLFESAPPEDQGEVSSTSTLRRSLFLDEKAISNVEELSVDWVHMSVLRSTLRQPGNNLEYLNSIRLYFDADENEEPELPIEVLQKAPNLKEMLIGFCNTANIFLTQTPDTDEQIMLQHLKLLILYNLSKLKYIVSEGSPWLNMICKKLHALHVFFCPDLTALVHSSSTVSFSYTKKLYISECDELKYLFTPSQAKNLMLLEEITIEECESIKVIVAEEQNERTSGEIKLERLHRVNLKYLSSLECFYSGNDTLQLQSLMQVDIRECPKLEIFSQGSILANSFRGIQASVYSNGELHFYKDLNSSVKNVFIRQKLNEGIDEETFSKYLQQTWHSEFSVESNLFDGLQTMKLVNCEVQPCAIPSHILNCLKSLKELQVRNCNNVKVIFDAKGTRIVGTASPLKRLTLQGLSELTHVWENNCEGILSFQNLQHVDVEKCKNLQSVFPAAIAKNLNKMENLVIEYCDGLIEIVGKVEDTAAGITEKFVLPRLNSLKLQKLPRLTYFYHDAFTLECPALKNLAVLDCLELELFSSGHPSKDKGDDRTTSINRQPLFSDLKVIPILENVTLDCKHISVLGKLTGELKWLKEIRLMFEVHENIESCGALVIRLIQDPEIGRDLPVLTVYQVSDLHIQSVCSENSLFFGKLYKFEVMRCGRLTTLAHLTSTITFSNLKGLHIAQCRALKYLFTLSVAKTLMHLEEIKVQKCKSMKEIVAKEQEEENSEGITFARLYSIELITLSSLECFYSGNATLQLPSLTQVSIEWCPRMEIFSHGSIEAKSFKGIQKCNFPNVELGVFHIDLNSSVKQMFLQTKFEEGMDDETFSKHLQEAWHGAVGQQNNLFNGLKVMKLVNCEVQPCAIPSNILKCLESLEELEVQDCKKANVIFDTEDTEIVETASRLQRLTLVRLSELTHVWENDCEGILNFQNLQNFNVKECKNLKNVFPAALAKNLNKLENLVIEYCDELIEIVGKVEDTAADITEKFVLPSLTSLRLQNLPRLTYFCHDTFTLECPALKNLVVLDCLELELFPNKDKGDDIDRSPSINRQPLFSYLKAIPILENVTLDWKHISVLGQLTEELKWFKQIMLPSEANANLKYSNGLLITPIQDHEIGRHLEVSTQNQVSDLHIQSFWSENPLFGKLYKFVATECHSLTALVHSTSTVSFSNLKGLHISQCSAFKYLFTFSVAKTLTHLEEIKVKECESIKEIVAKEKEEEISEGITFPLLNCIDLDTLSSLECFYSGNATLQLPSLTQVNIERCPMMEIFSHGSVEANSFQGIQGPNDFNDELIFHIDLNSSVQKLFLQQDHLVFWDSSVLKEIWLSETLPNWYFCNLTSMVVEGCDFLSNAILPSHLLPLLSHLKKLLVRKCHSLKAIFSHTMVIDMGSQGSLTPPALENLHVENCEKLVAIVANDEANIEEAHRELNVFSSITSLRLSNLPNLRCIYPGMCILEWGMLKELYVKHCQMLKLFPTEFENPPDSRPEEQDSVSRNQQASVSLEKVTPRLEVLWVGKEEAMMIEEGKLHIDLQHLNSLQLHCFQDESHLLPFVFASRVSLPSIQNFGLLHSSFKVIFPSQSPDHIDYTKFLSQLTRLKLQSLSKLKSIGLEHSWMHPFVENLKTLLVWECPYLANLSYSTVSFSNLVLLKVKNCRGLKYLLTSSTAKTLGVLKEMHITNCKLIKAIMVEDNEEEDAEEEVNAEEEEEDDDEEEEEEEEEEEDDDEEDNDEEEDDDDDDEEEKEGEDDDEEGESDDEEEEDEYDYSKGENEIIFRKLEILRLSKLPKLGSFYTGSSTLTFPSLEKVFFTQCHNKEVFRHGDAVPKQLRVKIDGKYRRHGIDSVFKVEAG